MKRILTLLLITLIAFGINGCKKGEDDPFLSLRTRTARLTGKWSVSKMLKEDISTYDGSTVSIVDEFDGETQVTTVTNSNGQVTTTTSQYTVNYEFRKDGTFTSVYSTNNNAPDIITTEGYWTFLKKNKDSKLKSKEAIMLTETKRSSQNNGSVTIESWIPSEIFMIHQLKNKEIVLGSDYNSTSENVTGTIIQRITLSKE